MNHFNDLHTIFAEYMSGEMTVERLRILESLLRDEPATLIEFIEYMNVDAALGDLSALTESEVAAFEQQDLLQELDLSYCCESAEGNKLHAGRRASLFRGIAALSSLLAATLLIMVVAWIIESDKANDRQIAKSAESVGEVMTRVDAVLKRNFEVWSQDTLAVGEFLLETGFVEVQFDGGVTVLIEAPSTFTVTSGKRIILHNGRLSASVPPEGVGFTVDTPEAEVIDFGTEFSLDVATGTSEVHVFKGLVRVKPRGLSHGKTADALDLGTSQAVKIGVGAEKPVEIALATHRFIRTFDESGRRYTRTVKKSQPLAFYRMAIRSQGLACVPEQYSGVVLTGEGKRPPHARGVFAGGSLRVLADSTGRGGRVDRSSPLQSGQFTLSAFVYLQAETPNSIVATNIDSGRGNFSLGLDTMGFLHATVMTTESELHSLSSDQVVPAHTWRHTVMTVDGERLSLYEDGHLVASAPCRPVANCQADALWFGTAPDGQHLWNGCIDEVALYDRALTESEIEEIYQAALEEMGNSE